MSERQACPPEAGAVATIPAAITVEEVMCELEGLEQLELQDITELVHAMLAARGRGPDFNYERLALRVLERIAPSCQEQDGIPVVNVRSALAIVSRSAMDAALLGAEARGRLRLLSAKRLYGFEFEAAIYRRGRGYLSLCAPGKNPALPTSGPSSPKRLRGEIQEAAALLRKLARSAGADTELAVVLARAREIVAARSFPSDTQIDATRLLTLCRQHARSYRLSPGVPFSLLRPVFPCLMRPAFDHMVRGLEERGLLRLMPLVLPAAFVEPTAGIPDAERGLLYYCAVSEKGQR